LSEKYLNTDFQIDILSLLTQGTAWNFEEAFNFVNEKIISQLPGKAWKGIERLEEIT
jgi:hypothetical protein